MSYLCLDTNILLLDANNLLSLGSDHTIVIPETVLDEADSKKSGFSEIAFQARELGRLLTRATMLSTKTDNNLVINTLELNNTKIEIVSLKEYPDYSDTEPNIINDRKIIEVALAYKAANRVPIKFMSNDVMCRIRAGSMGLDTMDLKMVSDVPPQFVYTADISVEQASTLATTPISTLFPDVPMESKSFVLTNSYTGQVILATRRGEYLNILDKKAETALHKQELPPINVNQTLMAMHILDRSTDVIVCNAKAGSGKTFVALSNAMELVSTNTPYESILYIRNTVDDVGEKDEEIGFLSGNDEKIKGYLYPFYDTIETIVRNKLKSSKLKGAELQEKVEEESYNLINKYNMQALTAMHMRGRTFNNAVVIIDEAQNMSQATMVKLLTRMGKNTKIIIIGSLNQIDSKYLSKYTSALSILLGSCAYNPDSTINAVGIPLHKVVRGPITEWAESLFSKTNK